MMGSFWLWVVRTSSHCQIACHVHYSIIWLWCTLNLNLPHLTEFGEKPTEVLDQISKLQRDIDKDE